MTWSRKIEYFRQFVVPQFKGRRPASKDKARDKAKGLDSGLLIIPDNSFGNYSFPEVEELQRKSHRRSTPQTITAPPATVFSMQVSESLPPILPDSSEFACMDLNPSLPARFCRTKNIALRLSLLPDPKDPELVKTTPPPGRNTFRIQCPAQEGPWEGMLQATCILNEEDWFRSKGFGNGAAGWLFEGTEFKTGDSEQVKCDAWITSTVFFIDRFDSTNPFQAHQDFLNTFLVYAAFDLSPSKTQPILLDNRCRDGPFTLVWSDVFSDSKRLIDVYQLRWALPAWKRNGTVCFKDAVWGIHGGQSPLTIRNGDRNWCGSSPVMNAFRSFMMDRLRWVGGRGVSNAKGMENARKRAEEVVVFTPDETDLRNIGASVSDTDKLLKKELPMLIHPYPKTITITYALRRQRTQNYPSKSEQEQLHGVPIEWVRAWNGSVNASQAPYKDFLAHAALKDIVAEPIHRILENEDLLVELLLNSTNSWLHHKSKWAQIPGHTIKFQVVDFASMSFEKQVRTAMETDVFIGTHGAAFVYQLYLRKEPVAGVLELKGPERWQGNFQFRNLAGKLQHRYRENGIHNPIELLEIETTIKMLKELLDEVSFFRVKAAVLDISKSWLSSKFEVPSSFDDVLSDVEKESVMYYTKLETYTRKKRAQALKRVTASRAVRQ
ncbi:hypothetical protein HDV05_002553 [Chytridiales sp. JEL 0842]|nr:hypothetical protein HDV05_002553 [Chytridiales sp. JEL 0842]